MEQKISQLKPLWTTVNGRAVFARYCDDGTQSPPVVLVHGLSVSGTYMVPTAVRLAPFYRTYVPDLPGFGKSAKPDHILNIPELADALAQWMKGVGLAHACLIGNSLGCQFIVDLALRYPELIDRAVLVGPTLDPRARSFWKQIGRGARDTLREPIHFWPVLTWDYLVAGFVRTVVTLQHAVKDPIADKLGQVEVPTLVVRGENDPIATQEWCEEMTGRLKRGRLVVIPGAAHVANFTAPDALAKAVREFLSTNPATSAVESSRSQARL